LHEGRDPRCSEAEPDPSKQRQGRNDDEQCTLNLFEVNGASEMGTQGPKGSACEGVARQPPSEIERRRRPAEFAARSAPSDGKRAAHEGTVKAPEKAERRRTSQDRNHHATASSASS
jgi:hypothetical protein